MPPAPIKIDEAKKIYDAIQKSPILRKQSREELYKALYTINLYKDTPAFRSNRKKDFLYLMDLAYSWNTSLWLRNISPSKIGATVQFFQKLHKNQVLKGKSAQEIEAALKAVEKWEKETRRSTSVPSTVRNALKISQEWNTLCTQLRVRRDDEKNLLHALSEWEKVKKAKNWEPEDILPALNTYKTPSPARDRGIGALEAAYALYLEWNKQSALKSYTFEILNNPTVRTVMASIEHGSHTPDRQEEEVTLEVMIAAHVIGHAGMRLGNGGAGILYDPSGSYSGHEYRSNKLANGNDIVRNSSDAFSGEIGEFDWDDYIAFHLSFGIPVTGYRFTIPRSHADYIKELIEAYGGRLPGLCASTISGLLKTSGGIFKDLPDMESWWAPGCWHPIGLGSALSHVPGVTTIRY